MLPSCVVVHWALCGMRINVIKMPHSAQSYEMLLNVIKMPHSAQNWHIRLNILNILLYKSPLCSNMAMRVVKHGYSVNHEIGFCKITCNV